MMGYAQLNVAVAADKTTWTSTDWQSMLVGSMVISNSKCALLYKVTNNICTVYRHAGTLTGGLTPVYSYTVNDLYSVDAVRTSLRCVNDRFFAINRDTNTIAYSDDGLTWTEVSVENAVTGLPDTALIASIKDVVCSGYTYCVYCVYVVQDPSTGSAQFKHLLLDLLADNTLSLFYDLHVNYSYAQPDAITLCNSIVMAQENRHYGILYVCDNENKSFQVVPFDKTGWKPPYTADIYSYINNVTEMHAYTNSPNSVISVKGITASGTIASRLYHADSTSTVVSYAYKSVLSLTDIQQYKNMLVARSTVMVNTTASGGTLYPGIYTSTDGGKSWTRRYNYAVLSLAVIGGYVIAAANTTTNVASSIMIYSKNGTSYTKWSDAAYATNVAVNAKYNNVYVDLDGVAATMFYNFETAIKSFPSLTTPFSSVTKPSAITNRFNVIIGNADGSHNNLLCAEYIPMKSGTNPYTSGSPLVTKTSSSYAWLDTTAIVPSVAFTYTRSFVSEPYKPTSYTANTSLTLRNVAYDKAIRVVIQRTSGSEYVDYIIMPCGKIYAKYSADADYELENTDANKVFGRTNTVSYSKTYGAPSGSGYAYYDVYIYIAGEFKSEAIRTGTELPDSWIELAKFENKRINITKSGDYASGTWTGTYEDVMFHDEVITIGPGGGPGGYIPGH